jgi:hypothetical protein
MHLNTQHAALFCACACVSTGAVLQLLQHLPTALSAAAAGPTPAPPTPLVYLSAAAADALATANSCCEYLEQQRQQQVLEFGRAPFAHQQLIKSGQLRILCPSSSSSGSSTHGDHTANDSSSSRWSSVVQEVLGLDPCVAFVPLWSLAAGE